MLNKILIISLFSLYMLGISTNDPAKRNILLKVSSLESPEGTLRIAVFDKEKSFLDTDKAVFLGVQPIQKVGETEVAIGPLNYGEYAVAIYHDVNNNGKLDTNIFGIPKEPYAFSNDAGSKWKKPSFKDAKILFNPDRKEVILKLRSWKEL